MVVRWVWRGRLGRERELDCCVCLRWRELGWQRLRQMGIRLGKTERILPSGHVPNKPRRRGP